MYNKIELFEEYIDENMYSVNFYFKGSLIYTEIVAGETLENDELKAKWIFNLFKKEVANVV